LERLIGALILNKLAPNVWKDGPFGVSPSRELLFFYVWESTSPLGGSPSWFTFKRIFLFQNPPSFEFLFLLVILSGVLPDSVGSFYNDGTLFFPPPSYASCSCFFFSVQLVVLPTYFPSPTPVPDFIWGLPVSIAFNVLPCLILPP